MRELTDLLERVEKATGPDRLLDHDIAFAFGWRAAPVYYEHRKAGGHYFGGDWDDDDEYVAFHPDGDNGCWTTPDGKKQIEAPPAYTASIDAALALVKRKLPGWAWFVDWIGMPDQPACHAEVWLPSIRTKLLGRERERGEAATPALAIIAALLRALQAEGGER